MVTTFSPNLLDGLPDSTLRSYALDCAEHVASLSEEQWMLQAALSEARGYLMALETCLTFPIIGGESARHRDKLEAMKAEQYRTVLGARSDVQSCLNSVHLRACPRCEEFVYRTCSAALTAVTSSSPRTYTASAMQSAISAVWAHQSDLWIGSEKGEGATGLEDVEFVWHLGRIEAYRDGRALPPVHGPESLQTMMHGLGDIMHELGAPEDDPRYDLGLLSLGEEE